MQEHTNLHALADFEELCEGEEKEEEKEFVTRIRCMFALLHLSRYLPCVAVLHLPCVETHG